jgi:hypothetical protein
MAQTINDYPYEISSFAKNSDLIKRHTEWWATRRDFPYGWRIISVEGRKVLANPVLYNISKTQYGYQHTEIGVDTNRVVEFEKYRSNSNRMRLVNSKDEPFTDRDIEYFKDTMLNQLDGLIMDTINAHPELRYEKGEYAAKLALKLLGNVYGTGTAEELTDLRDKILKIRAELRVEQKKAGEKL